MPDMRMISMEDLDVLNESRLWFEVSLSAGLTLLGLSVRPFNLYFCITGAIFALFGGFLIWRYKKKYTKIMDCIR